MTQLVAVYGSLRAGLHNHLTLGNSPYVSMGITKGWKMHSLGAYPALTRSEKADEVVVELYEVGNMDKLDHLEGYPKYYTRKQVKVETPTGAVLAWVYYMKGELTDPVVVGGDWKKWLKEQT